MQAVATKLRGRRGDSVLFDDVGFTLGRGEALVITGPNGSGKSTLLRIIAGLLRADSGRFSLYNTDGAAVPVAENAHYLGHGNAMKRELRVSENLGFWKSFQCGDSGAGVSVDAAIEAVGLTGVAHLPFGYLSAGQQRRIALARLLVSARPLWLLDEPTAALDTSSDKLFADLVRTHLAGGGLAIAATHQPLGLDTVRSLQLSGLHRAASVSGEAWT
ncbi:heme ABC exporter ATP-binding protein CcmA [Hoeflea sp. YIM 152468]|uniref:heme ABC exporter ATP-binding protein CcmA n=1 Tax=Hoeflea sp. YIM 152468 TaxID=3031759 RepID=UPI0023DB83B7|nr:heme ABC exporter ATP-binding protein CcmA [Hoeflea sp. YIM 152468]MDF1608189.1 heme ABC exporter ATP-binding protein CcmA [Hoeflea sp. YIM 152468]